MKSDNQQNGNAQIVYFSHGGGPLPLLGDKSHTAMVDFMQKLPSQLRKPDVILVISAHWEETVATVISGEKPALFYDYYGFPDEAYSIKYPAAGNPALAQRIVELLSDNAIPTQLDEQRGFDHGLFVPLKMMYPQADIPCVQLSLINNLDPAAHIALGEALRDLMHENILIIGSGFSFHNMRAFSWRGENAPDDANDAFQNWLIETCSGEMTFQEPKQRLIAWKKAPSALYCHPREEHLLPLHVCVGLSEHPAQKIFDDYIVGKRAVAFLW